LSRTVDVREGHRPFDISWIEGEAPKRDLCHLKVRPLEFSDLIFNSSSSFPEVECWSQAAESLTTLSTKYSSISTLETIERVNRLISAWPTDDTLPAEGLDDVKVVFNKLQHGLHNIQSAAEEDYKYENTRKLLHSLFIEFSLELLMQRLNG